MRALIQIVDCPKCGGDGCFTELWGGESSYDGAPNERTCGCDRCNGDGVIEVTADIDDSEE